MRLAVFTPQLGTVSETFVRRHVERVAPGSTVIVARDSKGGEAWGVTADVFQLDRWEQKPMVRVRRRLGASAIGMRDRALARFLRKHKVQVVLGEYLDRFADFVPLLERLDLPYVVQGHGIDLSAALRLPEMVHRYARYRSARAILTRCEFHRQRLTSIGLPAEKVHVNPGGIDVPTYSRSRGAESAKRLLAIGRLVPKKGPLYLMEAFRQAAARDSEISLDFLGDGPLLAAARQFAAATRLDTRIRLYGAASDDVKTKLLNSCGVFLQHSITDPETGDEEGLPAAIQEAMAHGLAVVSTRHSGISEAVDDGVNGILVDEGDSTAMAEAVSRLVASPLHAQQLGDAARAKAAALYSWPAERARLLEYLTAASACSIEAGNCAA